jgi:hypothetical protein
LEPGILSRESKTRPQTQPVGVKPERFFGEGIRDEPPGLVERGFAERELSRPLAEALQKEGASDPEGLKAVIAARPKFSARTGTTIPRKGNLRDEFTSDVVDAATKEKVFELDPSISFPARMIRDRDAAISAGVMQSAIKQFAVEGVDGVPVERILDRTGMRSFGGRELARDAAGKVIAPPSISGKVIPSEIADELFRVTERMRNPKEIDALVKTYDGLTSAWKFSLTVPFPAFHIRNLLTNVTMNWFAGDVKLRDYFEASKDFVNSAARKEFERLGVIGGGADLSRDILKDVGLTEGGRFETFVKGFAKKHPGKSKAAKAYATFAEDISRIAHYKGKIRAGHSPASAVQSVNEFLFDFSELTQFEKTFIKNRAIIFYNFTRKNIPAMFRQLRENTGKFAGLTRLTTRPSTPSREEQDQPIPRHLRRTAAIPFGTNAQGDPQFLQGIGSPLEEINKLDLTDPTRGLGGAAFRAAIAQANPLLRSAAELGFNKDAFFDQELQDVNRANAVENLPGLRQLLNVRERDLGGGRTRLEGDPGRLFISRRLPTSRLFGDVSRLLDLARGESRESPGATISRLLTGVRATAVDPADQQRAERQQVLDALEEFRATGDVRIFRTPFGVKDSEGEIRNPEAAALLDRLTEIRRAQRNAPGG